MSESTELMKQLAQSDLPEALVMLLAQDLIIARAVEIYHEEQQAKQS